MKRGMISGFTLDISGLVPRFPMFVISNLSI